jgi:hypothetical protein
MGTDDNSSRSSAPNASHAPLPPLPQLSFDPAAQAFASRSLVFALLSLSFTIVSFHLS